MKSGVIELEKSEIKYFFNIVNIGRFPFKIISACYYELVNNGIGVIGTMADNDSIHETLVFDQSPDFPRHLIPIHVVHVFVRNNQMDIVF